GVIRWQRLPGTIALSQLGRGMAGWDCQAHHIGERPGIVIGNFPDQLRDLGSEHRLAGDDLRQWGQDSLMITSSNSFQDEPIPESTREPNTHPSAGYRSGILLSRYRIVKGTVQVTERNIDSHPGNRE